VRLRRHQEEVERLCRSIAGGATGVTDILAAVTPGGGKSSLPVIAAARLLGAVPPGDRRGAPIEKICWVVPRDTLRRQAEEAFVDPAWRAFLGHSHAVRAAENAPDLCRGLAGYVTTYQAIAAAPDLHLAEFNRHRYLLCIDELHHLPGLSDLDGTAAAAEDTAWSRALLPLLETAGLRLLMTGTMERADKRPILWLSYGKDRYARRQRRVELGVPGWAVVGYSRRAALAERAIIPVRFGALDGEAEWFVGKDRFAVSSFQDAGDKVRSMLFTALRTGYADDLLRRAFLDCWRPPGQAAGRAGPAAEGSGEGLGKLLVVAPDQAAARRYTETIRGWLGGGPAAEAGVALAISDERDAVERIARFRMRPDPSVLVTVGMAYEGMDAPEVTHIACLTQIRSVPWLDQMVARATRFDPHGGAYEDQLAVVYHPDDPLFRLFRRAIEVDQSGRAGHPPRRGTGGTAAGGGGGAGAAAREARPDPAAVRGDAPALRPRPAPRAPPPGRRVRARARPGRAAGDADPGGAAPAAAGGPDGGDAGGRGRGGRAGRARVRLPRLQRGAEAGARQAARDDDAARARVGGGLARAQPGRRAPGPARRGPAPRPGRPPPEAASRRCGTRAARPARGRVGCRRVPAPAALTGRRAWARLGRVGGLG
jgi:superfamily II DNA or RNA helicase